MGTSNYHINKDVLYCAVSQLLFLTAEANCVAIRTNHSYSYSYFNSSNEVWHFALKNCSLALGEACDGWQILGWCVRKCPKCSCCSCVLFCFCQWLWANWWVLCLSSTVHCCWPKTKTQDTSKPSHNIQYQVSCPTWCSHTDFIWNFFGGVFLFGKLKRSCSRFYEEWNTEWGNGTSQYNFCVFRPANKTPVKEKKIFIEGNGSVGFNPPVGRLREIFISTRFKSVKGP